jgi:hypothetical protein
VAHQSYGHRISPASSVRQLNHSPASRQTPRHFSDDVIKAQHPAVKNVGPACGLTSFVLSFAAPWRDGKKLHVFHTIQPVDLI